MATRLVLLCAGATASARAGAFADPDEPLDAGGAAKAARLVQPEPSLRRCRTSSARAARETAMTLGLDADVEPALRDIDHGAWIGRTLAELERKDPVALAAWLAAPEQGAPDGESLSEVVARVGAWLEGVAVDGEDMLAITHAMVIRAALIAAIGVGVDAAFAIDIAPLSATTLSFNGRWRLQELRRA